MTQPRNSGIEQKVEQIDHAREVGQSFEWAIDRCHLTKQFVTIELGYNHDSNVISRWCSGAERVQLDKVRERIPRLYVAFLVTLLELEQGIEVRTLITLPRVG